MIKDNQRVLNRLHIVLDAIIVTVSYLLAWWLKFEGPFADTGAGAVSYTHLRAHETSLLVGCRLLLEKK